MTVACVLVPRFALAVACGERRALLRRAVALAPAPGAAQAVGEASGAAEAHGVRAGMRLGEALARCPDLVLVPPDPDLAAERWEQVLRALEGIGAAVEAPRPGEAFFRADGLRGLYGGTAAVLARARETVAMPARAGAAPSRFAAYVAAARARRRRDAVVPASRVRGFLAPLPVALLGPRLDPREVEGERLVAALERLGLRTLGEVAELPAAALADRFGARGLCARRLARGEDDPLRPRRRFEGVVETLELPEAAAGAQLCHALCLLVERLLANPARGERSLRALRLSARLAAGGGWRSELALRAPTASADVLRAVLEPRLEELPGPASSLALEATSLGPAALAQLSLAADPRERRRARLGEAVRQARAAAGPAALLRVVDVGASSPVPERRALLAPYPPPS